ncbi:hypothetical protein D3C75_588570 [compost metagenome]
MAGARIGYIALGVRVIVIPAVIGGPQIFSGFADDVVPRHHVPVFQIECEVLVMRKSYLGLKYVSLCTCGILLAQEKRVLHQQTVIYRSHLS